MEYVLGYEYKPSVKKYLSNILKQIEEKQHFLLIHDFNCNVIYLDEFTYQKLLIAARHSSIICIDHFADACGPKMDSINGLKIKRLPFGNDIIQLGFDDETKNLHLWRFLQNN